MPGVKVLRGGQIADGTGKTPIFVGDVHVDGACIAAVVPWGQDGAAPPLPAGAEVFDCAGKLVTPGWIDQHTHYDGQVTWDPYLTPSAHSGVTTVVMGNCGVGFAPVRPGQRDRDFLLDLVDAVEDIPGAALSVGIDWSWETFPQYLDKLDTLRLALDVCVLVGHAPVRAYVLGERASMSDRPGGPANDVISEAEVEEMAEIVRGAVAAGAVGFSTSRIILHRDKSGNLTPGSLAQEAEMLALSRAIAAGGGGVFEGVFDFMSYDDVPFGKHDPAKVRVHGDREWHWMTAAAREYGVRFSFPAGGADGPMSTRFQKMLEFNAQNGSPMFFSQVLVRPQGMLINFESRMNPFQFTPTFQQLKKEGKLSAATLRSPEVRAAIIAATTAELGKKGMRSMMLKRIMGMPSMTFQWCASYEPKPEESLKATAARLGVPRHELFYDWMCDGVLWRPMFQMKPSLEPTRKLFEHDIALPGVADGGAHGTVLTDATAGTSLLSWWARDRPADRGPRMSVEAAVMKQTSAVAGLYSLDDRGVLAPGKKADVNVIDLARLQVLPPEHKHDLPTGAPRWVQGTVGYELTLCGGEVTFRGGGATGALPGRLVRNPKSAAAQRAGDVPAPRAWKELLSPHARAEAAAGAEVEAVRADGRRDLTAALAAQDAGASALTRVASALEGSAGQSKL